MIVSLSLNPVCGQPLSRLLSRRSSGAMTTASSIFVTHGDEGDVDEPFTVKLALKPGKGAAARILRQFCNQAHPRVARRPFDGLVHLVPGAAVPVRGHAQVRVGVLLHAALGPRGNRPPVSGRPDRALKCSRSATSTSIRLIFGRIDRSRRVLEAEPKRSCRTCRMSAH